MKKLIVYISCISIFLSCISASFSNENKVMLEILKTLKDIPQSIHKTNPENLVKFRYSVQAVQASGERGIETSTFYKRGNRICIKSGKVSYFLDESNMFLILPSERTIIHHKRFMSEEEKEGAKKLSLIKYETMLNFQQILVNRAKVISQSVEIEAGRELTKVTFIPDHSVEELKKISQVQIWYDRKNKEIRRIWSHYSSDFRLREMIVTYEELNFNSTDKELKKEVSEYVINKRNQPVAAYIGYRLIEE